MHASFGDKIPWKVPQSRWQDFKYLIKIMMDYIGVQARSFRRTLYYHLRFRPFKEDHEYYQLARKVASEVHCSDLPL
jgi:hypothetical protein